MLPKTQGRLLIFICRGEVNFNLRLIIFFKYALRYGNCKTSETCLTTNLQDLLGPAYNFLPHREPASLTLPQEQQPKNFNEFIVVNGIKNIFEKRQFQSQIHLYFCVFSRTSNYVILRGRRDLSSGTDGVSIAIADAR